MIDYNYIESQPHPEEDYLWELRNNVNEFLNHIAHRFQPKGIILDIAPEIHFVSPEYFPHCHIETLDINPNLEPTYVADLCMKNDHLIPENSFDYILCTEVLEHTRNPFKAVDEVYRILKPGGYCFVTTPFNLRIHGPFPDCWRFTENGLMELFHAFNDIQISRLMSPGRHNMPIHYTLIGRK